MGSHGAGAHDEVVKKAMWLYPKAMGFIPSERWGHTACYSHGLVYVFGGCCGGMHFSDVLVLNLNTMAWSTLMTKGNAPGPRDSHSAVLWGKKMIVFGGTNGSKKVNDVHVLDLGTNEWIQPMCSGIPPSPRESHTASLIGDEKMVVFGGSGEGTGNYLNDLHILDFRTMKWTSPEVKGDHIPSPRDSHAAVAVGSKLFVYGGDCGDRYHGEVDVFDIDSLTWTRLGVLLPSSPGARAGHAAVSIGAKIYVIGGVGDKRYYSDVWAFNTNTSSWSMLEICGHPPQGRFSHTAIVTESDIAVYGGCGADERPLKELLVLHLGAQHPNGRYNISLCKSFRNNNNWNDQENATLHPKRRRMVNSSTCSRGDLGISEVPEEHSLSLSQHSSPSQSDHEQTSAQGTTTPPDSQAYPFWSQRNYNSSHHNNTKSNASPNRNYWIAEQDVLISPFNNNMDHRSNKQQLGHVETSKQAGDGRSKPNAWAQNLIGAEVQGKVDGVFDSGYLMTATVNGRTFRGVLFAPGPAGFCYQRAASQNSSPLSNKLSGYCINRPVILQPSRGTCQEKVAQPSATIGPVPSADRESILGGDLRGTVLTLAAPGSGHLTNAALDDQLRLS
ncbi:hypothetical protein Dimus_021657 [Dionaea muscipula]